MKHGPVTTDSGAYRVAERAYAFAGFGEVPYLDAVAMKSADGKQVTLFVVNRSTKACQMRVDLRGFVPVSANLTEIAAANRYEQNTEVDPQHIHPATMRVQDAKNIRIAAESVTMVVLKQQ